MLLEWAPYMAFVVMGYLFLRASKAWASEEYNLMLWKMEGMTTTLSRVGTLSGEDAANKCPTSSLCDSVTS